MKPEETRTLEEHLTEQIKKTGYPLEIETSNLLENKNFVVFNTQYYFDEEIQQGRDIDIYALPLRPDPVDDRLHPFSLSLFSAIECKKSETHAWVFYTRPRLPMSSINMKGQYETTVPELKEFSPDSFEWNFEQSVLTPHYDWSATKILFIGCPLFWSCMVCASFKASSNVFLGKGLCLRVPVSLLNKPRSKSIYSLKVVYLICSAHQ